MKPKPSLRYFSALASSALLLSVTTQAATLYWDGGSASWNTAANWSTVSGATAPDPGAIAGSADDAIFNITTANVAQNITLDAAQSALSITFNNTGTTNLRGNSTGTTARILTIGSGGITLNDGGEFILGLNKWRFDYNDTTGGANFSLDQTGATNYVTMTVIPEPRAALLGGLGLPMLLRRRA